jgi:hypothetical protein
MKKVILSVAAAGMLIASCRKNAAVETNADGDVKASNVIVGTAVLPQIISGNRTLVADTLYQLNGKVFVTGGTLEIKPGTRIEGIFKSSPDSASALIITKNGKIRALGQQSNPIIFTSSLDGLPGGRTNRLPGDWGGVVILGNAPTNKPTTQFIEGINPATVPAGVDVTYGGTNAAHDGGIITFARIEFAGAAIAPNNELNSLTLGGVGNKTSLRFIQASKGADDAFEFFGGTVNATYLIANSQNDDAFDFDFGYSGFVQFGLSIRGTAFTYADANGIECDNENPSSGATPTTRPTLSNLTILGNGNAALTGTLNAARFRRGTDLRFRNSIIAGYSNGIAFENTFALNTPLFYRNNGTHGFTTSATYSGANPPLGGGNLEVAGGSVPADWFNNANPATLAAYKSSALVYKPAGPFDPATAGGVDTLFTGLTVNLLRVGYVGALAPGSPVKNPQGQITSPNNWIAGSAGAWVNMDPQ